MLSTAVAVLGLVLSPVPLPRIQLTHGRTLRSAGLAMQGASTEEAYVTTSSGLKYLDVKEGTGPLVEKGAMVKVDYTGTLSGGAEFDSSRGRGPITFELGAGRVIPGWDEGIQGMRVGGQRKLLIPSSLGYGEMGAGAAIPPNSDLVFDTEVVGIAEGVEALSAKVPGGMPNLILTTLLALSFVPYFLPLEIRQSIPGFT